MARIKFDPGSPVIGVEITLYGKGQNKRRIKVALDTGATYTIIPWQIAEALGYDPALSREKITLITASGIETAPLIKVKEIKFLDKSVKNVPVVCHDLPPRSYVVGLLGLSFLKHFKITIDFKTGILEVE